MAVVPLNHAFKVRFRKQLLVYAGVLINTRNGGCCNVKEIRTFTVWIGGNVDLHQSATGARWCGGGDRASLPPSGIRSSVLLCGAALHRLCAASLCLRACVRPPQLRIPWLLSAKL